MTDAALSERRKAAILMDCLGVLAAISPPGQVMTFGQFRAGLTRPLRELLPATIDLGSTGDVVLLDAEGMLSPEAEDVCHEHFIGCAALDQHLSQARVRTEQEEQRLYLALRDLGAEGYTRARELLTDNPAGDLGAQHSRWTATQDEQPLNWYQHTATEILVCGATEGSRKYGVAAARLCDHAISWDGRTQYPAPLHLAM